MLKASVSPTASVQGKLKAGRYLSSVLTAQAAVSARLGGYRAVGLSASLNAVASVQGTLTRLHRVWLVGSTTAAATVTANIRTVRKVSLSASLAAVASTSAKLGRITRKFLAAQMDGAATVAGVLRKGRLLKASLEAQANVSCELNESSRSRATVDRTAIVPADFRTVLVPKGK